MFAMAPRLRQIVLDTTDVRGLAEFYRELLAWDYRPGDETPSDDDDWLVLTDPDSGTRMAFQLTDTLPVSTWPDPAVPQQLHLDLTVGSRDELAAERSRAEGLGATMISDEFDGADEPLYVFTDPAGHPFCIFVPTYQPSG